MDEPCCLRHSAGADERVPMLAKPHGDNAAFSYLIRQSVHSINLIHSRATARATQHTQGKCRLPKRCARAEPPSPCTSLSAHTFAACVLML